MLGGAIWAYRIFKDFEKWISSKKLNKNKSGAKDQYTIRCNLVIDVLNQKTDWFHCLIGCYMEKLHFTSFHHVWLIVSVYGTPLYSFYFV